MGWFLTPSGVCPITIFLATRVFLSCVFLFLFPFPRACPLSSLRVLVEVVEGVGVDEAVLVLFDGVASGVVCVGELVAAPRSAVGEGGGGVGELADGVVAVGVDLAVFANDLGALAGGVEGEGEG